MSAIELQSSTYFEWDDAKSEACLVRRGFDFAYALRAFGDPKRLVVLDDRLDYGEIRYRLLGGINGRVFCIAFTFRSGAIRIISARKANYREVARYEDSSHQR